MDPLLQEILGVLGVQMPVMQDHADINDTEYEPAAGDTSMGFNDAADLPAVPQEEEEEDVFGAVSPSALALLGVE